MTIMRTHTHFRESLSWDDFSTPESDRISDKYLPESGQGDTMMSQAVTAASKIIYRWFNDGDIFATANEWCASNAFGNDLSSYANWLDQHIPETSKNLARIEDVYSDNDYTQLLYDLMKAVFTDEMAKKYAGKEKTGDIYSCKGDYKFTTCPECGGACDEYSLNEYGMCYDCYCNQEDEEEDEDEDY